MKNSKTPAPDSAPMQESTELPATPREAFNLANHFLIAMPSMQDQIFGGAVVYVCEHNDNGVLGVIINKPTDMTLQVLFDRIDLKL
ncbi:MAG: putative transcriptional regulator, partial [Janthinobacterium sp.]